MKRFYFLYFLVNFAMNGHRTEDGIGENKMFEATCDAYHPSSRDMHGVQTSKYLAQQQ